MKIHTIDLKFQGVEHAIAAFLVEGERGLALVESGPGSTVAQLQRGVEALGFAIGDIGHVLVSHIHLDHAGAAGWLAKQGAQIYVHPRGAKHLIDPTTLIQSASMVYGDKMQELWGEILPVPESQVTVVEDGDTITVGDLAFEVWDTPGHARHHHAYAIDGNVFAGDVVGGRLPACAHLSVTSAPPQFDPVAYDASLARIADSGCTALYPTHFGKFEDVADHLDRYRKVVRETAEWVKRQLDAGIDGDGLGEAYERHCKERALADGCTEAEWLRYEIANPSKMCAFGVALYWKKLARG